jgi:hypothetical protein
VRLTSHGVHVDQRLAVGDDHLRLAGVLRLLLVIAPLVLDPELVLLEGIKNV